MAAGLASCVSVGLSADSPSKPVTNYVAYVGGKAGKANARLSPIVIGWIDQTGGSRDPASLQTPGARAAVKYVNEKLGGVRGHPVRLKECFIRNAEEEGKKCALQMANDKRVAVINFGAVAIGNQAIYSTIRGQKPILMPVAYQAVDRVAKNTYIVFGSLDKILAPWGTFGRDVLKAKTAAVIYPQIPGIAESAQALAKAVEKAGIDTKLVGFDPAAADLVGPLTAAGAQAADMIVPFGEPNTCVGLAKALEQLGSRSPVVSNPTCTSPVVAQGLGGDLPKWYYGIAASLPNDLADPAVRAYHAEIAKVGGAKIANDVFAQIAWSDLMFTVKLMNELGPNNITPARFTARIKAFRGTVPMGPPRLFCGKYKDAPASCNDLTTFYLYQGAGKFKAVARWLAPPR